MLLKPKLYIKEGVCYYKNKFVIYGKFIDGNYQISIKSLFGPLLIYNSKAKPIFKNITLIGVFWLLISPLLHAIIFLGSISAMYFVGAHNFFKNGADETLVREFVITNIIFLLLLIAYVLKTKLQ